MRSPISITLRSVATLVALAILCGCQAPAETNAPEPAPHPPETASGPLLVTGGTVIAMDPERTVIENGAVAIVGERIEAVGGAAELAARFPDARVLDARGRFVLPGLINVHTHVPMTLFRGLADDLELMTWLEEVIFPVEAAHVDEEFVRWGTRLACLEMIASGTTTFVDMYYFEGAIAEETARCGLRAVLGETLIDFPAPDNQTWEDAVAATETFLAEWKGHPLVSPAVAPHSAYTVSADHLLAARDLAAKHDVPLLIHLAEAEEETERVLELAGKRPVEYVDGLGVLDDRVLAAHMIWPDESEIGILAQRGVGVAHCPQSNMKIAAGIAPVPRLLAAGVAVGLGTDGAASNNDLDLWGEIDTAAKVHKVTTRDPTAVDAHQAMNMATLGGARAIDLDGEIGSLEVGKRADLIVIDATGAHQQPIYDVYSVLTYATGAADVETVIVNGKVLLENGEYQTLDPAPILAKAAEYRDRIRATRAAAGSTTAVLSSVGE
ncbi:MAG: amidohydrolase [bacterium]|nr:amidohydrolase [bacterium]